MPSKDSVFSFPALLFLCANHSGTLNPAYRPRVTQKCGDIACGHQLNSGRGGPLGASRHVPPGHSCKMTGRTISVPTVFGYWLSNIEDDDASLSSSGVHIEAADVRGEGAKRTRGMLGGTEGRAWERWEGGKGRGRGGLVIMVL